VARPPRPLVASRGWSVGSTFHGTDTRSSSRLRFVGTRDDGFWRHRAHGDPTPLASRDRIERSARRASYPFDDETLNRSGSSSSSSTSTTRRFGSSGPVSSRLLGRGAASKDPERRRAAPWGEGLGRQVPTSSLGNTTPQLPNEFRLSKQRSLSREAAAGRVRVRRARFRPWRRVGSAASGVHRSHEPNALGGNRSQTPARVTAGTRPLMAQPIPAVPLTKGVGGRVCAPRAYPLDLDTRPA
jgi:hypothetical protein